MVHEPDLLLGGKAIEDCHVSGVGPEDFLRHLFGSLADSSEEVRDALGGILRSLPQNIKDLL